MGSGGLVTETFSALLKELWMGHYPYVNPTYFKKAIQGYDHQFEGVGQHDSQEFFVSHLVVNVICRRSSWTFSTKI